FRMRGTRLIGKGRPPWRQLDLNLGQSEQGGEEQDTSHNTAPSNVSTRHTHSIVCWGKVTPRSNSTQSSSKRDTVLASVHTGTLTGLLLALIFHKNTQTSCKSL